jgi:DNA modification methylase
MPWRVAFGLQADGWWLRSDIIWHKPNPMPESIKDRPTKAHEYVFLLTKAERYFYDADAIKEDATFDGPNSPQAIKSPYGQGFTRRASYGAAFEALPQSEPQKPRPAGVQRKQTAIGQQLGGALGSNDDWIRRNKRSVWQIATVPFAEAHFATFPPELPEICIKAGCPKGGTVLDPFGGAGTTGLVADRLQRHAILIELNPEYAAMAEKRIGNDRGGLLDVMEAAQ